MGDNRRAMTATAHQVRYTYEEYVWFEASSNVRHEYLNGHIYAMAGATPEHVALVTAVTILLGAQLLGARCRLLGTDLRVRTPSGLTTYPDVSVICGAVVRDEEDKIAVTNPAVILEVLSRSTEEYDRGEKFEHYKTLSSLQQYVLFPQQERSVEVWTRGEDKAWSRRVFREGEVAELVIGARLDVRAIYEAAALPARP